MGPSRRTGKVPSGAAGTPAATDRAASSPRPGDEQTAGGGRGVGASAVGRGGGVVAGGPPRRRADRLEEAVAEQQGSCFWCRRPFSPLVPPTTDHVVPRVKGGPSWRENEVAACRRCNGQRGHLGPVEWLEECLRRGWPADPDALGAMLDRLDAAVADRGGQRRARPYLHSQRRRLERGVG